MSVDKFIKDLQAGEDEENIAPLRNHIHYAIKALQAHELISEDEDGSMKSWDEKTDVSNSIVILAAASIFYKTINLMSKRIEHRLSEIEDAIVEK